MGRGGREGVELTTKKFLRTDDRNYPVPGIGHGLLAIVGNLGFYLVIFEDAFDYVFDCVFDRMMVGPCRRGEATADPLYLQPRAGVLPCPASIPQKLSRFAERCLARSC